MSATLRTIDQIDRLNSSSNGNPRYRITFTDGSSAITMSDAAFCYSIGNPGYRVASQVQVEWSRAGRIAQLWSVA